jgi:hypothetical protein
MNGKYIERPVEVVELYVWDLRDGVNGYMRIAGKSNASTLSPTMRKWLLMRVT